MEVNLLCKMVVPLRGFARGLGKNWIAERSQNININILEFSPTKSSTTDRLHGKWKDPGKLNSIGCIMWTNVLILCNVQKLGSIFWTILTSKSEHKNPSSSTYLEECDIQHCMFCDKEGSTQSIQSCHQLHVCVWFFVLFCIVFCFFCQYVCCQNVNQRKGLWELEGSS